MPNKAEILPASQDFVVIAEQTLNVWGASHAAFSSIFQNECCTILPITHFINTL